MLSLLQGTQTTMPARGLTSPLSPSELNTLRRIAHAGAADLNHDHIVRLALLKLVILQGNEPIITALGEKRVSQGT